MNTLPVETAKRSSRLHSRGSELYKWLKLSCLTIAGALLLVVASAPIADAAEFEPEPVKDLSYGDALFEFYRGDYFGSATKLLVAQEQETLENHADDAELLLGGLYLSYGQQDDAAAVFETLLDTQAPEVRDRAWLYLAEIAWQRGNNERASTALSSMGDDLDDEFVARRQLLEARIAVDESVSMTP